MKKLLFLLVAGIAGTYGVAKAQIQKGNVMWGGDIIGANVGLNSGSGFDLNLSPKLGYFVKDNLAVGGYVNLGVNKAGTGFSTKYTYGIGGFGRYYLSPGEHGIDNLLKHGRFFAEVNAGFAGQNQKGQPTNNGFNFGFGPGYAYFITPNVGLEGLIKYNGTVGGGNTTYLHAITFGLGFQVYLPSSRIKSAIKDPSQL